MLPELIKAVETILGVFAIVIGVADGYGLVMTQRQKTPLKGAEAFFMYSSVFYIFMAGALLLWEASKWTIS